MTIVEVVEAIRHFSEAEKAALAYALYHSNTLALAPLTREQVLAEIASCMPTSKANVNLWDKMLNPTSTEPDDEEIADYLRELSTDWEEELNELGN